MAKKSSFILPIMVLFSILLIISPLVSSHVTSKDDDNLRDLYELLLRSEVAQPDPYLRLSHQMERKGGRSPSLRLRFGRRSDPFWSNHPQMAEINQDSA